MPSPLPHHPLALSTLFGLGVALVGCPGPSPVADAGDLVADAPSSEDASVAEDASTPEPFPAACENVNARYCLAPWPSNRYLVDDASTRTGRRIEIPREAMPANRRRVQVDPTQWNVMDGFSPATSIVTVFPGPLDLSVLADERHIAASLDADSATILLRVHEDGSSERVAHYAEIDSWPDVLADETPLYIRPAARLEERTRYVVAIRGLRSAGGAAIEPSDYFRALRDGEALPEAADLEARRAHFESLFSILEGAGVERASLIEAWDFDTASDESLYADLVVMRDEAIRQNEVPGNCRITIDQVEEAPEANVYRRLRGTVRVPLFTNGAEPGGGTPESVELARIHRGADGRPEQNPDVPFAEVPFTASIPSSVHERIQHGGDPVRLLTYGHGLFGDRNEIEAGWFRDTTEELEMFGIAVDWWGMSSDDVVRVTRALNDFSSFSATPERLQQGITNFVVLTHSFIQAGRGLCEVVGTDDVPSPLHVTPDGGGDPVLIYDPDERYFYGNSQGGIMGLALAGVSTDIERFVSGVGGMSYSIMIPRSMNWQSYGAIMRNGYSRQLDRAFLMTMAQSQWDLGESSTYARFIHDTLPCTLDESVCPGGRTPNHRVLMMIGQDDAQVANVTSDMAARTIGGVPLLLPAAYEPWGLATTTGSDGATEVTDAMVTFAIPGTPELPLGTRDPLANNPAHEGVRRSAAGHRMMDRFLRPDGVIEQTCDGVCDPD